VLQSTERGQVASCGAPTTAYFAIGAVTAAPAGGVVRIMRGMFVLVLVAAVARPGVSAAAELPYDLRVDTAVIAASLGVVIAASLADIEPTACRWCERDGLNPVDTWFRDRLKRVGNGGIDVAGRIAAGVVFAGTLGLNVAGGLLADAPARDMAVDVMVVAEAVSVALAFTTLTKIAAGRQRPYVLDVPADQFGSGPRPGSENTSFFSGHTAVAFSLATSAGMVASMRRYRLAPLVWIVGLTSSAVAGILRISDDEHYFTDLAAGAAAGAAIGVALPYLLHRPRPVVVAPAPVMGGTALVVQGYF
jgi:membrane-associated phospholipid phosphatase